MNNKDFDPQSQYNRLQQATNVANQQMYGPKPEAEIKVQIFPDKSVAPAMFIPNQSIPGTYRAHPVTIRAMRPDIFAGANNELFDDLEYNLECSGCHKIIDLQFWKFCPYCEKQFPKDLPKPLK